MSALESGQERDPSPLRLLFRKDRSPLGAKSVLASAALFLASAFVWLTGPAGEDPLSWMTPYAPALFSASGSFLGGFLIGWFLRRALKVTSVVAGIVLAAVGLAASFGWDGSAVQGWVDASVAWATDSAQSTLGYLVAFLPSAAAAAVGGAMGFRRKPHRGR
jgi:uncharacterized membrane protein (Fun14 family)